MDIDEGGVALADVLEEVARSYGFDNIPTTTIADALPPQVGNPIHEWEEQLRDLLVALGLQEAVTYRMTSVEKEARVAKYNDYVRVANPIAPEKSVLRRSLTASVLDALEKNIRLGESLALFEVGSVFEPVKNDLPNEWRKFAIAMTGLREATAWDVKDSPKLDFYDMKGRLELLLSGLRLTNVTYAEASSAQHLHPGGKPKSDTVFKVAAHATWTDPQTLLVTLRYFETPHSDTLTCRFEDDTITITLRDSITAMNPKAKDSRPLLKGKAS